MVARWPREILHRNRVNTSSGMGGLPTYVDRFEDDGSARMTLAPTSLIQQRVSSPQVSATLRAAQGIHGRSSNLVGTVEKLLQRLVNKRASRVIRKRPLIVGFSARENGR